MQGRYRSGAGYECLPVPYHLDLFVFKDVGVGSIGILSKHIPRLNIPSIGGYTANGLPEPVVTWYNTFFEDYNA